MVSGILSHFLNQTLSDHFHEIIFKGIIPLQAQVTIAFSLF